jgi:hypothetical protein
MRQKVPRPGLATRPAADLYRTDANQDRPFSLRRQTPPRCTCRECVLRSISRAWMQIDHGRSPVAKEILNLICLDLVESSLCGSASLVPGRCAR